MSAEWIAPTVSEFKARFVRDFPYAPLSAPDDLRYVTDADIQVAIDQAQIDFNCVLYGNSTTQIFYFLAAHTLVMNLRNSSQGLNSQAKFPLESASVGSVSISNKINDRFAGDPMFYQYLETGYGKTYLQLVYPFTVGNVQTDCGTTTYA